ncbi:MAG: histidine triad nucleotide-binding protein [Campylobacteraceae bacterium]|jgi:histidine triad (HIT) family protein|nr:histidine triad nucleotide-binding protein [Campylobacteraceae bacterium]
MTVFHKILAGEIPCSKVYEDEYTLAFHDINPKAPIHILVIPKVFSKDFENVGDEALIHMTKAIREVTKITGLNESGYRLITNVGKDGGQEVPYIHFHVLGGKKLKWTHLVDETESHKAM